MWQRDLDTLDATEAFGRRLGERLFPGAVVALVGPLGSGKTHLVRAITAGLGVPDRRIVNSPTFVILQEYQGRLPIYHFDAYRLRDVGDWFDLGAQEYTEGQGVCLIEWADRVTAALPAKHLQVTLAITGPTSRRMTLEPFGAQWEAVIRSLDEQGESGVPVGVGES